MGFDGPFDGFELNGKERRHRLRWLCRTRHVPVTEYSPHILAALVLADLFPAHLARGLRAQPKIIGGMNFNLPLLGEGSFNRRSEEHTSELQSHSDLVCRLLLEKKKKQYEHQEQSCQ